MNTIDQVNVFKVRETAKIPQRAHPTDAGIDFYYCPEHPTLLGIEPGQSVLLPTGIKMEVPSTCMLQIMNKSGIASKKSLVTGACVVDSGYDGEIFVNLHNIGKNNAVIAEGDKMAQAVLIPIVTPAIEISEEDNIYGKVTSRGDGCLGSTGED